MDGRTVGLSYTRVTDENDLYSEGEGRRSEGKGSGWERWATRSARAERCRRERVKLTEQEVVL